MNKSSAIHRLTNDDLWDLLGELLNIDELLDEIALSSRHSIHGTTAYAILRAASGDTILPLAGRLRILDARNAGA